MNYDDYKEAKREFFFYKRGSAGGFQTKLFDLFGKADIENQARLGLAFPMHLEVIRDYMDSESEEEFFKDIKG